MNNNERVEKLAEWIYRYRHPNCDWASVHGNNYKLMVDEATALLVFLSTLGCVWPEDDDKLKPPLHARKVKYG